MQWSKQIAWRELYTENDQIWAADVETSQRKLLFEINIVGQESFPLIFAQEEPHAITILVISSLTFIIINWPDLNIHLLSTSFHLVLFPCRPL